MNEVQMALEIPKMSWDKIVTVKRIEALMQIQPQLKLMVEHTLHAGLYARTVRVPERVLITGVLVKIPTVLIVNGDCGIWIGNEFKRVHGYKVFSASAFRKQIFIAKSLTILTMCFPTAAKTVKEAEEQFTDEAHLLQNREA